MGVVPQLALAQIRYRPSRYALLALGVSLALALPIVGHAIADIVSTRTLSAAIAALPPGERSLIVSYGGNQNPAKQRANDLVVRNELARLSSAPARRQMLFGELTTSTGTNYYLGATDSLAQSISLTSGRLPMPCTPTRCEVVQIGTELAPDLDPSLGVVIVGRGTRIDSFLLPGTFNPGRDGPLLLAEDADAAERLTSLALFPRGSGWVAPLDTARIADLGVSAYTTLSRQVSDELALSVQALVLTSPDDPIAREDARAQASQGRFAILGGSAAVLILGFAFVTAAGLRREHGALVSLLRRRGASRKTTGGLTIAITTITVAIGALIGILLGSALAALLGWGQPVGPSGSTIAAAAVRASLPIVITLAIVSIFLASIVLLWPEGSAAVAWHVVELSALMCLLALGLAASRGAVTTATTADPLLVGMPVLALLSGGLLAVRTWPHLVSWVVRRLPARALSLRLAGVGSTRRPLRAVATVGFLTAAVGSVVFSGAYRATLIEGAIDQAAYIIPTDVRITTGSDSASPLDVLATTVTPGTSYPVVRSAVGVRTSATSAQAAELVGIEPNVLPQLSRWDRTSGDTDPDRASQLIRSAVITSTITIPSGTRTLVFAQSGLSASTLANLALTAWFSDATGRESASNLVPDRTALIALVPPLGSGIKLTGLVVRESELYATQHQHKVGEGGVSSELLAGTMTLSLPMTAAGVSVGGDWVSWSSRTAEVSATTKSLRIAFVLAGQRVVVRAGLTGRPAVPLLADPVTAALVGTGGVRLDFGGGDASLGRVVGVLPRFPTAGQHFLVADQAALSQILEDHEPGTGAPREIWLIAASADNLGGQLSAPPFDRLTIRTQTRLAQQLSDDPVGQGSSLLLIAGAILALLIGGAALVLLAVADRRDDAGELLAYEADGVGPRTLRRILFFRAVLVSVPALMAGVITGLLLARAAATLVAVSGSGAVPNPPLILAVGPTWTGAVLGVGLAIALGGAAAISASLFREPWPARPEEDLL